MKRQLCGIFEHSVSFENICAAWTEFARGKRGKPDVQFFARDLMENLACLQTSLAERNYRHGGYERFSINDPKPRRIHKASVRDRVMHHAVYRILYPFFDRTFIADSFACRVGKGSHAAINRFRSFAFAASKNHTRTAWVLQCDIRKFFASVNHETLFAVIRERVSDPAVLWLIQEIVGSFQSDGSPIGLPLGNLTSQLFANLYLNELDQFVKHRLRERWYVRYADDFVIISSDRARLVALVPQIRIFLHNRLHLALHEDKVKLKTIASGVDFLGWIHFPHHRVLRTVTQRRILARAAGSSSAQTLQSYLGLVRHGNENETARTLWNQLAAFRNSPSAPRALRLLRVRRIPSV